MKKLCILWTSLLSGCFAFPIFGYSGDFSPVLSKVNLVNSYKHIASSRLLPFRKEDSVLITFGDVKGKYGFKSVLRHLPFHEVNVRDTKQSWFSKPFLKHEANDAEPEKSGLLEALVDILANADLDHAPLVTLGSSMGGFAALYYGALLSPRVKQVIAFSPQTLLGHLSFGYQPSHDSEVPEIDLRPLLVRAVETRFYIILREDNASDVFHALRVCDLPNVFCSFLPAIEPDDLFFCDHNSAYQLKQRLGNNGFIEKIFQMATETTPVLVTKTSEWRGQKTIYNYLLNQTSLALDDLKRHSIEESEFSIGVISANAYLLRKHGDYVGFLKLLKICLLKKHYRKLWHELFELLQMLSDQSHPEGKGKIDPVIKQLAIEIFQIFHERVGQRGISDFREEKIQKEIMKWENLLWEDHSRKRG